MSGSTALMASSKPNAIIGVSMKDLSDVSTLIFNSKVFGDLQTKEAAAIKIIAGQEYGFSPFQSMSMFDFIQGRPTLNAHGKATLINSSGDFRLRIKELTSTVCVIDVCRKSDQGEWKVISTNSFTLEDAKQAELTTGKNQHSWKKYPRNMLFARCVSNIWRWECSELNKRRFDPEQITEFEAPELAEDGEVIEAQIVEPSVVEHHGERVDTATGEVIDAEIVDELIPPTTSAAAPEDSKAAADPAALHREIEKLIVQKIGETPDDRDDYLNGRDLYTMTTANLERMKGDLAAM